MKSLIATILFIAAVWFAWAAAFIVPEGQQALVTEFGKIVGDPIDKAGLHFKMPIVNDVRFYDKRILAWDGDDNPIPTKDKKFIFVDATARWRIKNLQRFAETAIDEARARTRLDGIFDGVARNTIARYNLVEVVRNSNAIIKRLDDLKQATANMENGGEIVEEEISGEIEKIKMGREKLSEIIVEQARVELDRFGIELIDVQLRRISYDPSVEGKVFDRMISERKRIAEKIRAIGKGEEARIQGDMNRELKVIESGAYKDSQAIRGKGEAEAIAIYAKALNTDPEFYSFIRTMEAYKKTLPEKGNMILSTNSEFLRLLKKKN